jgi:diguanylate cyclase (GGDEF)-like protein
MRRSVIPPLLALIGLGFLVATAVALFLPAVAPRYLPLVVLVLGGLTVATAGLLLNHLVSAPLRRIIRTLQRVSKDNFVVRCENSAYEPGEVGTNINVLLKRLTDLSVNVIDTDRELQWTQKELKLKEELAEKSRLLQATNSQLEDRLKELSLLFAVSRSLSSSIELDDLLQNFCRAGARTLEVEKFAILTFDKGRNILVVRGIFGFDRTAGTLTGMRVTPGEGVSGTVFEKRTMLYIRDLAKDHRFLHFRGKAKLTGSLLGLPLPHGDECVGVMLLNRARTEAFSFEDVGLFHIIANQVAGAVANALLYQTTRELAVQDELTGLYNRRMLERRLEMEWERSRRFSTSLSCIMVDVDHFKKFNDEHGHLIGDEVLKYVGGVLKEQVRKVDTVARFGGEEFAILLPRTTPEEAHAVAEKLREAIQDTPFRKQTEADDIPSHLTISAGVASTLDSPQSVKQLVDMADTALLLAKSLGRNRVIGYGKGDGG